MSIRLASTATDADLALCEKLTELQSLRLYETQVTDAGLTHLKGMRHLRWLSLPRTQVTDAGLRHLEGLSGLWRLDLPGVGSFPTGEHLEPGRLPRTIRSDQSDPIPFSDEPVDVLEEKLRGESAADPDCS